MLGLVTGIGFQAVNQGQGLISHLKDALQQQDLLEASAQRPIDQEQFLLLEHIAEGLEKLTQRVDNMMNNKVNI